MTSWKVHKTKYNEGSKITTSDNPVWDCPTQGAKPVTPTHTPCGYWFNKSIRRAYPKKVIFGSLWGAGSNGSYQLGLGHNTSPVSTFTQTGESEFFTKAQSGNTGSYSFALRSDGTLWVVGSNQNGCLGLGDTDAREVWTQVPGLWKDFACSPYYTHTMAVKKDGTLWATGSNNYGQLGLGNHDDVHIFTQVGDSVNWISVECGSFYSIAMDSDRNIFGSGDSYEGSMGSIGSPDEFTYIPDVSDIDKVSCGYYSTAALKMDGTLWVTGSNADGQLGLGDTTAKNEFTQVEDIGAEVTEICMGYNGLYAYSGVLFVIKRDGTLWAAGSNLNNIMGLPDTSDKLNFVQLAGSRWDKISSKDTSVMGIKEDGTLWGCGLNSHGEFGTGDTDARTEFEQLGDDFWLDIWAHRSTFGVKREDEYYWVIDEDPPSGGSWGHF